MGNFYKQNKIILICFGLYILNITIFSLVYYDIYNDDFNSKKPSRNFLINNDLMQGKIYEDSTFITYEIKKNKAAIKNSLKIIQILKKYEDTITNKKDLINFSFQPKVGSTLFDNSLYAVSDRVKMNENYFSLNISYGVGRSGYSNKMEIDLKIYDEKEKIDIPIFENNNNVFSLEEYISRYYNFYENSKKNIPLFIYVIKFHMKELSKIEKTNKLELEYLENVYKMISNKKFKSKWNFIDFYYFSTTSLILNTYGDILPNSTKIRKLLTFESFINLFILLLFINLKFNEQKESK